MVDNIDDGAARDISKKAKAFVFLVFLTLALSFLATSGVLVYEFWDENRWFDFAAYYSHLFIFFPTFGIIALYAFYLPAIVFVDLYWQRDKMGVPQIKWGRTRFLIGTTVMIAGSIYISNKLLEGRLPTIWELKPAILAGDQNVPAQCTIHIDKKPDIPCKRLSINNAVMHVRALSSSRVGLSKFIRNCKYDPLLPEPLVRQEIRHCFANGQRQTAAQCCQAQKLLGERLISFKEQPDTLSMTGLAHKYLLPFKVFFLIMLLTIGGLLVLWSARQKLKEFYICYIYDIEKSLLSGVAAMLFWPLTNHAFLQSATVLFGYNYHAESLFAQLAPAFSILFSLWAALIVFFFIQQREKSEVEFLLKIMGVFGSFIAVLKYNVLIDWFTFLAGSGANFFSIFFMGIALLLVLLPLLFKGNLHEPKKQIDE